MKLREVIQITQFLNGRTKNCVQNCLMSKSTLDFPGGSHGKESAYNIENPKDSIRKSLELIREFSEVAGFKINTQKSLSF